MSLTRWRWREDRVQDISFKGDAANGTNDSLSYEGFGVDGRRLISQGPAEEIAE